MVTGKVAPEKEYATPLRFTELTVTGVDPLEERVRLWVEELPTFTLPKLSPAGLSVNCGVAAAGDVPEPLRLTVAVGRLVASLLTVISPVDEPAAAGLKVT